MISDALSVPEKVKSAGVAFTLSVLMVAVTTLGVLVHSLYEDQTDKRLAIVEIRLDEMDKKIDKMDAKIDKLDAKIEAQFDKLDVRLSRALER